MAIYLNTNAAYKDFRMLSNDKYFVDKSNIIEKINERINTKKQIFMHYETTPFWENLSVEYAWGVLWESLPFQYDI